MSSLQITCIQSDLQWENKEANLEMFSRQIRALAPSTEIVVLPEMFSTGFSMEPGRLAETMDGPTVTWMASLAREKRLIITGSLIIKEGDDYFNRLIWMLPNGQTGIYDKRHLFGFAGEDQHYSAGNKRLIASVKGWKINLQICYDLRFPVWARQSKSLFNPTASPEPEYDLLVYVANWPERRVHAWKTLLQARAIENQCYVVGVNRVGEDGNGHTYSGDSMIVDPLGQVLATSHGRAEVFSQVLSRDVLDETRTRLPFLGDADSFLIENL